MLEALNWMSISQKIRYNVLVLIFKMLNGLTPNYLNDNLIHTHTKYTIEIQDNKICLGHLITRLNSLEKIYFSQESIYITHYQMKLKVVRVSIYLKRNAQNL